jgi:hypothetical protein
VPNVTGIYSQDRLGFAQVWSLKAGSYIADFNVGLPILV